MRKVTLLGTQTVDHISYVETGITRICTGGPAHYCKKALEAAGCHVTSIGAEPIERVQISVQGDQECVVIDQITSRKVPAGSIVGDVLLSPILGEFDLANISESECRIFLDAQGYIKKPGNSPQMWSCHQDFLSKVAAMKVNHIEKQYVPPEILSFFKERLLVITHGSKGLEIWEKGESEYLSGRTVSAINTLGAGDTFWGFFVGKYLLGSSLQEAAQEAMMFVEEMLRQKK